MGSKRLTAKTVAKIDSKNDMAKVQNLRRRGHTFYYHRDIPKDVQTLFGGKTQLWISLKTTDFSEAKRLCLTYTLEHDQEIEIFRKGREKPASEYTEEYLETLATAWAIEWLRTDEKERLQGIVSLEDVRLLGIAHRPASLRKLLSLESKSSWDGITPLITSDFLKKQRIDIPQETDSFKYLCAQLRAELWKALEIIEQRINGIPISSPQKPQIKPPVSKVYLGDLLTPWKLRQKPKQASIVEFERSVNRFTERFPKLPIQEIETVHVVEYRDHLSAAGLAGATVEKHLNSVKALLSVAVERGLIKYNPASKVKPPKAVKGEGESREPFTVEQLNLLFSSPIYTGGKIPAAGKGEAAFWLPLLGLFTGARVEELCQLRGEDVLVEDSIKYLFIRRKHKEQDTKTESSIRRIPIHPTLTSLGFLDYVEKQRSKGKEWIFSELVPDAKGNRSGNWSKWFHRYLRETVGIKEESIVFHSFRHTFKATCRECSIPEDIHDALTGHTNGSVGRSYGGSLYPLRPLWEAISRYHLAGLMLPKAKS